MSNELAINRLTVRQIRQLSKLLITSIDKLEINQAKIYLRVIYEKEALGEFYNDVYDMCREADKVRKKFRNEAFLISKKLEEIANRIEIILNRIDTEIISDISVKKTADQSEIHSTMEKYLPTFASYDNISQRYFKRLMLRYNNSDPICRKVFKKYKDMCLVRDSDCEKGSFYSSKITEERGIYFNSLNDLIDDRGACVAFYHEVGHMIDHAAGNFNYFLSDNPLFRKTLEKDTKLIMQRFDMMNDEQKIRFTNLLYHSNYSSVSDLLRPLTNERLSGKYGHEKSYWEEDESLIQKEAFAHFFEAFMGGEERKIILKKIFPNAYYEFKKMLRTQLEDDYYE